MKTLKVKHQITRTFERVYKRKSYPDNNSRLQYIPLGTQMGILFLESIKHQNILKMMLSIKRQLILIVLIVMN